ncbi:hypothetical protein BURK1_03164 [Burkholderiales bacterium]|nr:hypothetical protein BURK1_03164 [Burkholderiales bacterium]
MNTPITPAATAATLPRVPSPLGEALRWLRAMALRVDAWLGARKRAAEDLDALAAMSDRDLLDIGIDRASIHAAADGAWRRDFPV